MSLLQRINTVIDNAIDSNQDILFRESIKKIHPELHTYRNSINILVGKQGAGKTYTALREIIKITFVDPSCHMIIIVNKEGRANDATYEVLKSMFQVPVIFLSNEDATDTIKHILSYKEFYNNIKLNNWENEIEDNQINELLDVLRIKDLKQPFLNTIIYFEDVANSDLFKKNTQYFPQLVARCRHNGLTLFFAVQFWKGLTTELKSNATTIYIFRDYSMQQLSYILHQTPLHHDMEQVHDAYRQLNGHDKLVVDTVKGKLTLDRS
jgi:hypothetical protein